MKQKIDRMFLKSLRAEIDEALNKIGEKYDMTLKLGRTMSFSDTDVRGKFEGFVNGSKSEPLEKDRNNFTTYAKMFDLDLEWLDKEIRLKDQMFKVVGLKPRRTKYPVLLENTSGKQLLCSVETIKLQFK